MENTSVTLHCASGANLPFTSYTNEAVIRHENLVEFHQKDDFFRIEHWYQHLAKHTFPTTWFPIPISQARALTKYTSFQTLLLQAADQSKREENPLHIGGIENWDDNDFQAVAGEVLGMLSEAQRAELDQLKLNIQGALESLFSMEENENECKDIEKILVSKSAFIRLSTRSPKDSALTSSVTKRLLVDLINKSAYDKDSEEAQTEDIIFFTRALGHALQIRSADDAMALLFRSQRTFGDLMNAELFLGDDFEMNVILRRWVDIYPEWEFRAFVYQNQITSCTQYNPHCYVPEMAKNKDKVQELILAKWNEVKGDIPRSSYTIDFVLEPSLQQVWVVEVNHLPPVAGTGMFDWDVKADREIIEHGPFELRVRTELDKTAKDSIHQPLRRFIDLTRGRPVPGPKVSCDQCTKPTGVPFYHCKTCTNFDVCRECVSQGLVHSMHHQLVRVEQGESGFVFTEVTLQHQPPTPPPTTSGRCSMM